MALSPPLPEPSQNGQAFFDVVAGSFPAGNDTLVATYTPDAAGAENYTSATASTAITVTAVSIIKPTVYIEGTSGSIITAQNLELTISVYGPPGDTVSTGSVYVTSGSYKSPGAHLGDGQGRLTVPGIELPPGTDTLTATYVPDAVSSTVYSTASQSTTVTVTVGPLITPTAQANVPDAGVTTAQALPLTVSVGTPTSGYDYVTPTGTVTASSGAYISPAATLSNGNANITIPAGTLPVGNDTLTFSYTPDSVSAAIYTSATNTQMVTVTTPPANPPSFAIAAPAISLAPGATTGNTSAITVTPANGFTGSVSLVASITSSPAGAKDPPTLSFGATSPVTINAAAAATATLTVATTPATQSSLKHRPALASRLLSTGGSVLACLLFFCLRTRRPNWTALAGMLALFAVLAAGLSACGGGGSGTVTTPPVTTNPGTTAGAYTITVTATSGSETQTTTLALTVQ